MARRRRHDIAGAAYHVMNRGSARRTIFDTPSDFRFFLSCLARAVRREEIEVLAYSLMRTHFHLFLRSRGGLSTAMRRIQLRHVRRFNRTHRRDGPLMRSRFLAKRVRSDAYGCNVVRYTHENPVLATLCDRPAEYPWSSAWLCSRPKLPRWFNPTAIQRYGLWPSLQEPAGSERVMLARADFVEARLHARGVEDDRSLDRATPDRVLDWMKRKAHLADGTASTPPLVGARTLLEAISVASGASPEERTGVPGGGTYSTRELLSVGLLREVAVASFADIAATIGTGDTRARRLHRLHGRCLVQLPAYAERCKSILRHCLEILRIA